MSDISKPVSRRNMLAATAVGGVLSAATLAQAAETMPEPRRPGHGGSDPGPKNPVRASQNPDMLSPPATDQGTLPNLRFSFEDAHMRLTSGGWTRQVTARELGISKTIAGVCGSIPAACVSCIGTRPPNGPTCSPARRASLRLTPPELVNAHLHADSELMQALRKEKTPVV
jgi:hypothetical protein